MLPPLLWYIGGVHIDGNDPFWSFSGVYLLLLVGFVAPPPAYTAAGLTVERLFRDSLGNEKTNFLWYHLGRTTLNRILHAVSVAFYCIMIGYVYPPPYLRDTEVWGYAQGILIGIATIGIFITLEAYTWWTDQDLGFMSRRFHPLVNALKHYEGGRWKELAQAIEQESLDESTTAFLGVDNSKVLVTRNWLVAARVYDVYCVPHRAVTMEVDPERVAQHVTYRHGHRVEKQVVSVNVTPTANDCPVSPFSIRVFGTDFTTLSERLQTEINNVQSIVLEQTPDALFETLFTNAAYNNRERYLQSGNLIPHYAIDEEECVACLSNPPDVKIMRMCTPDQDGAMAGGDTECRQCHCRPFWCLRCLARWFLHRQPEHYAVQRKLQGTANCPTCRATYCVQDVLPIYTRPDPTVPTGNETANSSLE